MDRTALQTGWWTTISGVVTLALLLFLYPPNLLSLLSTGCSIGYGVLTLCRPRLQRWPYLISGALIVMNALTLMISA